MHHKLHNVIYLEEHLSLPMATFVVWWIRFGAKLPLSEHEHRPSEYDILLRYAIEKLLPIIGQYFQWTVNVLGSLKL